MRKGIRIKGFGTKSSSSHLEDRFSFLLDAHGVSSYLKEFVFARPRRWRFDFAFPDIMLAVEIEGGTWTNGRHLRPLGFEKDCEKYNAASCLGWTLLRFTGDSVKSGACMDTFMMCYDMCLKKFGDKNDCR